MRLKQLVKSLLLESLFRSHRRPRNPCTGAPHWSVLVLDRRTLPIIQACFLNYELTKENVARVDLIEEETDKRRPTSLHAIYFLSPVSVASTTQSSGFQEPQKAAESICKGIVPCSGSLDADLPHFHIFFQLKQKEI